jgi:hypothetical protein
LVRAVNSAIVEHVHTAGAQPVQSIPSAIAKSAPSCEISTYRARNRLLVWWVWRG